MWTHHCIEIPLSAEKREKQRFPQQTQFSEFAEFSFFYNTRRSLRSQICWTNISGYGWQVSLRKLSFIFVLWHNKKATQLDRFQDKQIVGGSALLIRKWNPVWATPQEERLVLLLPIAPPWDVFHLHPGCQDHFYPRCQDHHPHINNEWGNCAICIPTTFLRHNPSWLLATHSQSKATSSSRVVKTISITNPNNH